MGKDRFCVNAIPIPEDATNEDMIKAVFPNVELYNDNRNLYRIFLNGRKDEDSPVLLIG